MDRSRLASAVEKQLQCPICLLKFKSPKLLECMHTFCEGCLANVAIHSKLGGIFIRCPTCRQRTMVTDVTKLPKNFIVQNIIDTLEQAEVEHKEASGEETECGDTKIDSNVVADGVNDDEVSPMDISIMEDEAEEISRSNQVSNVPFPSSFSNVNNSETNNFVNYNYSLTPSFNFGQKDQTSFALPTTTATSLQLDHSYNPYNFSTFNTVPSFTFGSIDKASFVGSNDHQLNPNSNEDLNENKEGITPAIENLPSSSPVFKFNAHSANTAPSCCWGSLEKTSFAQ